VATRQPAGKREQLGSRLCAGDGCLARVPYAGRGRPRYCDACRREKLREQWNRSGRDRYARGYRKPRQSRLCSGGCGRRVNYRPERGSREQPVCRDCRKRARQHVCEQCGAPFEAFGKPRPGKSHKFCSDCRAVARRRRGNSRSSSKVSSRARKLRHTLTWDFVTDEQIFERDEGVCRVPECDLGPIRFNLKCPHPLSPTIDHIIPLSRGGTDTAPNKRSAHWLCNVRRGNRMHPDDLQVLSPELAPLGLLPERRQPKPPEWCAKCGKSQVKRSGAVCTSCASATRAERQDRILACRGAGMKWADIAVRFGLSSAGAAYNVAYGLGVHRCRYCGYLVPPRHACVTPSVTPASHPWPAVSLPGTESVS
jgi:hypothetical protein